MYYMCVYKRIKQVSVSKGVKLTVNCLDRYELYRLSLELDGKKRIFMDRFFCFLLRTKSVLRLKNGSRTGKTDDFSSPAVYIGLNAAIQQQQPNLQELCLIVQTAESQISLSVWAQFFKTNNDIS